MKWGADAPPRFFSSEGLAMPKRYRHLWERCTSFETLWQAYRKARKGKRGRAAVAQYELDAESRLLDLQQRLREKRYQPGSYRTFSLHEWKRRLISAAPFEDRIVHHALCSVLEPIWEARFIYDSYACRRGKGTLAALNRAQHYARHYPYVLQLDIQAFFPSIDHAILQQTLQRHLADPDVLALCYQIMHGGRDVFGEATPYILFEGDDLFALGRPRGLPIGNLTSQFWANVYLHPFDLWVKQTLGCGAYLRYCDDLLFFHHTKQQLHAWQKAVIDRLAQLRLLIHTKRAYLVPTQTGFPYLGWFMNPTKRRLRRRNVVHFWRRYRQRQQAYRKGQISFEQLQATVYGWLGSVKYGQTIGLRRSILATPIPKIAHG